jgi:DNA-binding LacI/PurR family transcriptional regulator
MRGRGKSTSLEVAHLAGVSQSTVSRALRGSATVNEATRRRIVAVANELHYKVDKNASSLRTQQTATLALLFFEDPTLDASLINPFFLSMLGWITRACANRGYDLLISFQHSSGDWLADCQDCKKADGAILLGYGDYVEYLDKLRQLEPGAPVVRWGAVLPEHPGVSIGCDNHQGSYDVTRHLVGLGRRQIAFLGHASEHYPEFLERHRGYAEALSEAGLPVTVARQVDAVSTELSGYEAALELLRHGGGFDAIVCASDLIAIGAMRALQENAVRIPEDVAVTGFDDIPSASFANPSLTTVQQDTKLAGTLLVDNLIALIHGEPVSSHMLPARTMLRRSTLGEAADRMPP